MPNGSSRDGTQNRSSGSKKARLSSTQPRKRTRGASPEWSTLARNAALAALAGAGPDRALAIVAPTVDFAAPRNVPADATINLVGRRPDIAAARASVEAAASRIKVARAAFYPNISIGGLLGFQALGFGNVLKSGSLYGNVCPAVSLPLFEIGALDGQYRGARGQYDEAVAHYDGAVIQALREVADALASRNMLAIRHDQAKQALDSAEEAYSLARRRYQGGLSTYLDVLSAEEGVLGARQTLAELEIRALTVDISMVRALGGGFATT